MTTVKQIERAWTARRYQQLFADLVAFRPEAAFTVSFESGWAAPVAALGMIRLDELGQNHVPFYNTLLKALIATQQRDGGWGDLPTTALCLRALMCGNGQGEAIARGLTYLAQLQKPEGIWPRVPLRRMPEDPLVSAFVLFELGDRPAFQSAVQLDDALVWFAAHDASLDEEPRDLWHRAALRCRVGAETLAAA